MNEGDTISVGDMKGGYPEVKPDKVKFPIADFRVIPVGTTY